MLRFLKLGIRWNVYQKYFFILKKTNNFYFYFLNFIFGNAEIESPAGLFERIIFLSEFRKSFCGTINSFTFCASVGNLCKNHPTIVPNVRHQVLQKSVLPSFIFVLTCVCVWGVWVQCPWTPEEGV